VIHPDVEYPDVATLHEERRELFRLAAVAALRNGGERLSAEDRARHEHWARVKPLGRALSDGTPRAQAHLGEVA
jgi:hypothetical protein